MAEQAVTFESVSYTYNAGTALAHPGITEVNLNIPVGSFTVIIGQTGSGKSTLVNLVDGLTRPTSGRVIVNGHVNTSQSNQTDLAHLRQTVGFVFQFPEQQLFADTVAHDIAFGPQNLGQDPVDIQQAVEQAMQQVGLPNELADRSPFSLSGGQQKLVAIAGVLAMQPQVLILDEPTAGLDSQATRHLLHLLDRLHAAGITIIMISHQLELIAARATQVVLMHHGQPSFVGDAKELFAQPELLQHNQLPAPVSIQIANRLGLTSQPLTIDQLADQLAVKLKGGDQNE